MNGHGAQDHRDPDGSLRQPSPELEALRQELEDELRQEGFAAYCEGHERDACPYPRTLDPAFRLWVVGWDEAHRANPDRSL